jgi:hypothetical protein
MSWPCSRKVVMSRKQYIVTLTPDERDYLVRLASAGRLAALTLIRARILLKADASPNGASRDDARIAEAVDVSVATVERVRRRFTQRGLRGALARKPQDRPIRTPRLDGQRLQELAHQSPRNFGKKRSTWTLQLLVSVR